MRSYLDLIGISNKVNKKTTRLVRLCIVLSVFLVTAIFGLAEMAIRMEASRLIEKHDSGIITSLMDNAGVQLYLIVAFVLFLLVLIASVLMIASSINSNIAQRTKFYGLMRCIGMTKKQIKKYVRREALSWCKLSIPLGNVLGIFTTWVLCLVMKYGIAGEFAGIQTNRISIISIFFGACVGLISVVLAAQAPAKKASSVNPIIAVSDQDTSVSSSLLQAKHVGIDTVLGMNHAFNSKKNLFLLVSSFALSIILFLAFSTLVQFVNYIMPQLSNTEDLKIIAAEEGALIDPGLVSSLERIGGVKRVYARNNAFDVQATVNGTSTELIDIVADSDFDLESLKKDGFLKNNVDVDKIKGNSFLALSTWDKTVDFTVGDELDINDYPIEVVGLLKQDIYTADGMTHGKRTLIVSNDTFEELMGEVGYSTVLVQLEESISEGQVKSIIKKIPEQYLVEDNREYNTASTYWIFTFFVYSFIVIIALVAMLNIINAISVSVTSQFKRYGMMRGIGMELRQIKKVIIGEACVYSIIGLIFGSGLGLLLSKAIFDSLIGSHFEYATWEISPSNIIFILLFVILATTVAVESSFTRVRKMDVVSQLS